MRNATHWFSINGLVLDVREFGAEGNGGDDRAPIQAAIDAAAAAGGGMVFFPRGTYGLSASLTINGQSKLTFLGAGASATSIATLGNFNAFTFTGVCTEITIARLWIGSFAARTSGTAISVVTTGTVPSDSFVLEDLVVQNLPAAILWDNVHRSVLNRVVVIKSIENAMVGPIFKLIRCISIRLNELSNLVSTGLGRIANDILVLDSECDTVVVLNSELGGSQANGVRCVNTVGSPSSGPRLTRFTNVYSESNDGAGFLIEAGRDVRLTGCHSAQNGGLGFGISGGDSVTISDSLSLNNGYHGYHVTGGQGTSIQGCTSSNNSQSVTNTYDGIRIEDGVTHTRIVGNRSGDFVFGAGGNRQRYGVSVGATGTNFVLCQSNDLSGNSTGGLGNFSGGANNAVGNNLL